MIGLLQSKKERIIVERGQEINKGNQLMLRKLIEIDMKKSDLNRKTIEPVAYKARKSINKRRAQIQKLLDCAPHA